MNTPSQAPERDLEAVPQTPPAPKQQSRLGATWVALGAFSVVLVVLLIFILENSTQVTIDYFGETGHLQLGVLVLLGAVAGIVLTLLLGSLRIIQLKLRHRAQH